MFKIVCKLQYLYAYGIFHWIFWATDENYILCTVITFRLDGMGLDSN